MVFKEEVVQYDIQFCRFGRIRKKDVNYCKVGIFGRAGLFSYNFLQSLVIKKRNEILKYLPIPYFIPGHQVELPRKSIPHNPDFVLEALRPAPIERVIDFRYYPEERECEVVVSSSDAPLFIGKKRHNINTAWKLTNVNYKIRVVDKNTGIITTVTMTGKEEMTGVRIEKESEDIFNFI
jgi:hypothetical protein